MSPIVAMILQLVLAAPGAVPEVQALWDTIKASFSAKDQATVDGILAFLNPRLDTDIAALHAAVLAPALSTNAAAPA